MKDLLHPGCRQGNGLCLDQRKLAYFLRGFSGGLSNQTPSQKSCGTFRRSICTCCRRFCPAEGCFPHKRPFTDFSLQQNTYLVNFGVKHAYGVLGLLAKLLLVNQGYEQDRVVQANDIFYKLVGAAAVSQIHDLGPFFLHQIELLVCGDFVTLIDLRFSD